MARPIPHMPAPPKSVSPFGVTMATDAGFEVVATRAHVAPADVVALPGGCGVGALGNVKHPTGAGLSRRLLAAGAPLALDSGGACRLAVGIAG
ncbi:MAG: hypothetical protein PGN34_24115 [Methylobacterium frigidaeris]